MEIPCGPFQGTKRMADGAASTGQGNPDPRAFGHGGEAQKAAFTGCLAHHPGHRPSAPLIELIPAGGHKELFFQAAALLSEAHEAGLFHQDLHAGNMLVGMADKKLYLIDLHRSRFLGSVSRRRRIWNLAQFFYSLQAWLSPADKMAFLQQYDEEQDILEGRLEQGFKEIERQEQRIHRRHMRSRTKRCLKQSGGFSLAKEAGWQIGGRRGWKPQGLLKIGTRTRGMWDK